MSGPEETEIKVPVSDLAPTRSRLTESGAERVSEPHHERNILFDDPAGHLSSSGKTLRLRRARGRGILTFKGPPTFDGGVKRREEREVEVSDAGEAEAIVERLGYVPRFRYEKRREELRFLGCVIALDETPIGSFVEIEGPPEAIGPCASALGLDAAAAVRESYAGLYRKARARDTRLPPDMLFPDSP